MENPEHIHKSSTNTLAAKLCHDSGIFCFLLISSLLIALYPIPALGHVNPALVVAQSNINTPNQTNAAHPDTTVSSPVSKWKAKQLKRRQHFDTTVSSPDTTVAVTTDTTATFSDPSTTTSPDTVPSPSPPAAPDRKPGFTLEGPIDYPAYDSIIMDMANRKTYLFGNYNYAEITYQNIHLKAGYIEIDMNKKELYARGFTDSTGTVINRPVFREGNKEYQSRELRYNFDTRRGIITGVFTEEGQGYLHGSRVKKEKDNSTYIQGGMYTTCDLEHPHYHVQFNKARVIPSDKIVTGPANLIIQGVPTPVLVPFGIFPNVQEQSNGILMPSIGESGNRGFFLRDVGYYWGFSDYMDLALTGDVYSRGSWAANATTRYNVRYRFSGALQLEYSVNKFGDPEAADYREDTEFFVRWRHQQSPEARPNANFNAQVQAGSMQHNQYNPQNANDYLSNTFSSSINYSTMFAQRFNLSAGFRHSQNTITKEVDLTLPQVSLSVQRFYPFRKKQRSGPQKWYENITMSYTMDARNEIKTTDSLLMHSDFNDFRNGIKHSVPIRSSIRLFDHLNLDNTLNINGYMYSNSVRKNWSDDTLVSGNDTLYGYVRTDTIHGFTQGYDFSFTSGVNTKLYGMFNFKRGPVKAMRHVLTPSVNFNYRPDFGKDVFGYHLSYMDGHSRSPVNYSIFQNAIYGGPPSGESGRVSFNLQNNLEAKVRDRKDTTKSSRKVMIIRNLSLNMSYDVAKDSLNWSPLTLNAYTTLLNTIDLRFMGTWDPYVVNEQGRTINVTQWERNRKLFRRQKNEWVLNASYRISSSDFGSGKNNGGQTAGNGPPEDNQDQMPSMRSEQPGMDYSASFDHKWNLGINYTFRYTNTYMPDEQDFEYTTIQTLGFNANINLTDKWRIGMNSGWDFESSSLSYTSVDIYRDLHCWEMMFNWIPIGFMQSYNLTIRVKAPALHDLKLTKRKSHLDRF